MSGPTEGDLGRLKTVLLVDDDQESLAELARRLPAPGEDFGVLTAASSRQALAILREQPVSLVVTALELAEVEGSALVSHLARALPSLPVLAITALEAGRLQAPGRWPLECYPKPVAIDLLREAVRRHLDRQLSGRLRNLSVAAALQMLSQERRSCAVLVTGPGGAGRLLLRDGELVGAATAQASGEEAAYAILAWEGVIVEFAECFQDRPSAIQHSLGFLLIDAARRHDEAGRSLGVQASVRPAGGDEWPDVRHWSEGRDPAVLDASLAARFLQEGRGCGAVPGFRVVLLGDWRSRRPAASWPSGESQRFAPLLAEGADDLSRQLFEAHRQRLDDSLEEVLIAATADYRIIRPLARAEPYFLMLILDRQAAPDPSPGRAALAALASSLSRGAREEHA